MIKKITKSENLYMILPVMVVVLTPSLYLIDKGLLATSFFLGIGLFFIYFLCKFVLFYAEIGYKHVFFVPDIKFEKKIELPRVVLFLTALVLTSIVLYQYKFSRIETQVNGFDISLLKYFGFNSLALLGFLLFRSALSGDYRGFAPKKYIEKTDGQDPFRNHDSGKEAFILLDQELDTLVSSQEPEITETSQEPEVIEPSQESEVVGISGKSHKRSIKEGGMYSLEWGKPFYNKLYENLHDFDLLYDFNDDVRDKLAETLLNGLIPEKPLLQLKMDNIETRFFYAQLSKGSRYFTIKKFIKIFKNKNGSINYDSMKSSFSRSILGPKKEKVIKNCFGI